MRITAWCQTCGGLRAHDLEAFNTTNVIGKCRTCGRWHGAASPTYKDESE